MASVPKHSVAYAYTSKPKPKNENIERECLKCGRYFVAPTRFIRLCAYHTKHPEGD